MLKKKMFKCENYGIWAENVKEHLMPARCSIRKNNKCATQNPQILYCEPLKLTA